MRKLIIANIDMMTSEQENYLKEVLTDLNIEFEEVEG